MKELKKSTVGDTLYGFSLEKKEYVTSFCADLYTLKHIKTGAELLYFDRADENKTFSIAFKTLPEDNTGVFHILEHSVLNGSKKYDVKEPFVSMLQSSMQTFLNAMTFCDKTLYPVSSRNAQDFFNLMSVYLDAVFCPAIYNRPEIFMQEGWHYEFSDENADPYFNGVVFSEMKGVFSDVDSVMEDEINRVVFPDNCYGFISGGHPDNITDLTYEKFIETHKRFYHPTNSKIILDGNMDIDRILEYIDGEYLSKYDYRAPDFDFVPQIPKSTEKTVTYEIAEGEEEFSHIAIAKILCSYKDTAKIYAAKILADCLAGSNEAPLKRAFLEAGLGNDVSVSVYSEIFQPRVSLTVRNTQREKFDEIKTFLPKAIKKILADGLDKDAILSAIDRMAFIAREITEPYGVELSMRILESWLYGGNPLTHIDNAGIFDDLREKANTDYFEKLLSEMFGNSEDKSYLYAVPSLTKGEEDAAREAQKIAARTAQWDKEKLATEIESYEKMQQWQQSVDSPEKIAELPHLNLSDIPLTVPAVATQVQNRNGTEILKIDTETNGIVYLNMFFDISDFTTDELQMLDVMTSFIGELATRNFAAKVLQNKIKSALGAFSAKVEITAQNGNTDVCKPYLLVGASMLQSKVPTATELIKEILLNTRYDDAERISETVAQDDYFLKQSLIGNGHVYAIKKALSAFSAESALKEHLEGETFVRRYSEFAADFKENSTRYCDMFAALAKRVFAKNRLFVGCSSNFPDDALHTFIDSFDNIPVESPAAYPEFSQISKEVSVIEIPASVGYSAIGANLRSFGENYNGSFAVLSSLMTYSYLWNEVRVQGGAYGTGMSVRMNGDIFCYSYRDPNLSNSKTVFGKISECLKELLSDEFSLDDIIIGTVNTTDPLLDPNGICSAQCLRYLKGITHTDIETVRREILSATPEALQKCLAVLQQFEKHGKFCAVGDKNAVSSVK